jgi:hypothetical protein
MISGNTSSLGSVYVSGGMFAMSGGKISGNTGSGVGVYGGTSMMSGGEISGNDNGVFVSYGTFTMSGGEISGNTASSGGGGVCVYGGTFTMSGGEISGNTASSGGGVYVSGGIFTMSGGEISGNIASYSGGGVYVINYDSSYNAIFTKNGGGTIYGLDASDTLKNTATGGDNYGHAVCVDSSSAKKRNATADTGVNMNSNYAGAAGGWEE